MYAAWISDVATISHLAQTTPNATHNGHGFGAQEVKELFFFFYKLKVSGISLQIVYMCQHVFDQNAICVLENLKRSEKHCFSNLTYKLYFKSFITHMCVCFPASLACLLQNIVIAVKYWVILNVKIVTDNIIAGLMQRKK